MWVRNFCSCEKQEKSKQMCHTVVKPCSEVNVRPLLHPLQVDSQGLRMRHQAPWWRTGLALPGPPSRGNSAEIVRATYFACFSLTQSLLQRHRQRHRHRQTRTLVAHTFCPFTLSHSHSGGSHIQALFAHITLDHNTTSDNTTDIQPLPAHTPWAATQLTSILIAKKIYNWFEWPIKKKSFIKKIPSSHICPNYMCVIYSI